MKKTLKPGELKKFVEEDRIVYDEGRLSPEFQFKMRDLDQIGYLDKQQIIGRIPVVLPDSPVLYAYLMFIHTKTRIYASLETTVREIHMKIRVVKGLRWLIKRVIADCVKCRLMGKKPLELKLAKFNTL